MTTFTPGQQLLVTDPDHPMFGKVGITPRYDCADQSKQFVVVDQLCWPIAKDRLEPVESPPYESEGPYTWVLLILIPMYVGALVLLTVAVLG